MSEPFPVWITKHCLRNNIQEAIGLEYPGNSDWCVPQSGSFKGLILQKNEWHRTKKAALAKARSMLDNALKRARQELEELESVCFTEDDNEGTGDRIGEGERRPTFGGGDNPEVDARHRPPSQNEREHFAEPISEVYEEGRF